MKILNEFCQGELTKVNFLVIFEDIAIFSSFNPSPSLPSVATDDRKQFQWRKMVLNNKARPDYFWNSIDTKTLVSFLKRY